MAARRRVGEWPGKSIQRKVGAAGGESPELVDQVVGQGGGSALDATIRQTVESHVGADLSHVRVHSDERAHNASESIGARAFTYGSQVFLGPGESATDLALMAHELTHVVQQGAAGQLGTQALAVGAADHPAEREADAVAARAVAGPSTTGPKLVEQSVTPQTGQMTRDAFLARLRPQVVAVTEAELGRAGATAGCPYIEHWFGHFATAPAAHVERFAQRFSGRASVANAADYIPPILERLRDGVRRWMRGDNINPDLQAAGISAGTVPVRPQGLLGAALSFGLQRKPVAEVVERLGPGQAIDPGVASRFGAALGQDVSGTRVHTGEVAARMANSIDAAAFTVGNHVAFGANTYQPGTPRGDALLAHELAHVAQQKGANVEAETETSDGASPVGDEEVARTALATESTAHETDADQAGAGAMGRLYGGAKSVLRKVGDTISALSSEVRLQRCPQPQYEQLPEAPQPVQDPHLPMPLTVSWGGDRFIVSFEGAAPELTIVVHYDGPHRTRNQDLRLTTRLTDAQFTGVGAQAYNATEPVVTERGLTVDLLGDHSRLVVLTDQVRPGFYMESRSHHFEAAMTSGNTTFGFMDIDWYADSGVGTPPAPNATTDPSVLVTTVQLAGWPLAIHAQRFGTGNQVQLRLGDSGLADTDELVPFDHLDHVTLTVITNTGRDLHLDLDGDGRIDVRIVHTIEDAGGMRTRHLRSFTADGLLLHDHLVLSTDGVGTPIPPNLDERTHRPDTSLEWPANRPPAQGDLPGELPRAVERPGGITELRVDSDGGRRKDILMRFHPETTDAEGRVSRVRIDMVQVSSSVVVSQTLDLDARHAGRLRPTVRDVADGLQPLLIDLTDNFESHSEPVQLSVPTPTTTNGRTLHTITVLGRTLSYDLPAEAPAMAPLVQPRPDAAPNPAGRVANVNFIDLQIGEQRDQFRFTAENAGGVARFSVAGLNADGSPFTGAGLALLPGTTVTNLTVVAGDPRQIAFDINDDGRPDILINDRFSQPTRGLPINMAEPIDVGRQHIMSIHGPRVLGVTEHPFFIFAGRWYQRYGFGSSTEDREAAGATGAVSEIQRQRGEGADIQGVIDHFAQAVATQRHDAIQQGVITQEIYDEWRLLFEGLTSLRPAVLPTGAQPPTTPDAGLVGQTAQHAANFARLLAATVGTNGNTDERVRGSGHTRRDRRRTNRYTGEVDEVTDVHQGDEGTGGTVVSRAGANIEIEASIRGGQWADAYRHYTTLRNGLDLWIADEMARRFGPQGQSAHWQLTLMRGMQETSGAHENTRRVQAVFVADTSYSNHADYNTYRQMPLYLLIWREGTTWHLKDLTNPQHPYEHSDSGGDATNPSPDLFGELDYAREFPKGVIRYDIPNGFSNRVTTTERKTWVDYVGYAAMILGAAALAATGVGAIVEGAAVIAVFNTFAAGATVAAGIAGAVAAGGDMYERARHGDLDATTVVIDIAQMAAGILTAGAASSRILVNAARTGAIAEAADPAAQRAFRGFAARAALVADRAYIPLTMGAAGADVVSVIAMVPQTLQQLLAVANGPGSAADRTSAITVLLGNLLAMGAITAMSVRGGFHEMRTSRPNIVVDFPNGIPVARAAGVSIGGVEIRVAPSSPDAHSAARWNAHALEEAAHGGSTGAQALTQDEEFMRWYRAWMEQPHRVDFSPEGQARVRPFQLGGVDMPETMRTRLQAYLDNPANALSLYERSFINGERIRRLQSEIPGLDLNPASDSWQRNRARIIAALGGDEAAAVQVRRYEAALLGAAAPNPAHYAAEHTGLTSIVPETELARIRQLYAGYDVYVTGAAPRARAAGAPPPDVPDVDIFVVVPPGTTPEMMQAMESRAAGYRVRTDPDFNAQHGHPADHSVPLDAKVMTPEQFAGFATTAVPAVPGQRARTPMTYHSLGATGPAVAGTRQASAQTAFRITNDEAAADRLMTALGDHHARLDAMVTAVGDPGVRQMVTALGEERFGRYAAVADGPTIRGLIDAIPDARLRVLEARLTPQQIADVWRGGGAPAIHMAEGLADAELSRVMTSLGGERFGRYAGVPGMDGATLGRLVTQVPDATLRAVEARVQPRQMVDMFRAGGAASIERVNGAITLEVNGRIHGLNDWIAFADGKGVDDLRRTLGELPEAARMAAENPGSIINIGGDQRAPRRAADGSAMRSFDMTVESPSGTVNRSVEVTTVEAPVNQMSDVTPGVRHAADKVQERLRPPDPRDVNPIPGEHDATIRMTLDVGDARLGGGRIRRIAPDGELRVIDGDGVFRARPGNPTNLFDDIGGNLGTLGNNGNLSRVTLVDQSSGAVLARYQRTGTTWARVP